MDDLNVKDPSQVAPLASLLVSVLLTRSRAFQMGVTATMILRA